MERIRFFLRRIYRYWAFSTLLAIPHMLIGQEECIQSSFDVLGSVFEQDRGYSMAVDNDKQCIYIAGLKDDSTVIIKLLATGNIEWVRTMNLIPNGGEHIARILVDSEGMLAAAGIHGTINGGGSVFAFRYDPIANELLWTKEFRTSSNNYCNGLLEKGAGGNYLMLNNPQNPNNAQVLEIERATGSLVNLFKKDYSLNNSDSFGDMILYNGSLYATGRFSFDVNQGSMRHFILNLNKDNGVVNWLKLGHKSINESARLYGASLKIIEDHIYSVYMGDENGSSIDDTEIFIQKTTINGELVWVQKYPLPGSNDWADEILFSENGFVIMARNRVAPSDLYLFKITKDGNVLWTRRFDYSEDDNTVSVGSTQGQLVQLGANFYFTAYAGSGSNIDMVVVKTDLEGRLADTCTIAESISIDKQQVKDPEFFPASLEVFSSNISIQNISPNNPKTSHIQRRSLCNQSGYVYGQSEILICAGSSYMGLQEAGIYLDTFNLSSACDSIHQLTLNLLPYLTSSLTEVICAGQNYEGYSVAGIYQDTFQTAEGCDSIRSLTLQIATSIQLEESVIICQGQSYRGHTEAGIFIDTLKGIDCDTLITISLSMQPVLQHSISQPICPGDIIEGYSKAGMYIDTFTSRNGCDSVRYLNLLEEDIVNTNIIKSICDQNENEYNIPGIYIDTFLNIYGCDSIRTLELEGFTKYIPNVFSPNKDGLNDVFEIEFFPEGPDVLSYFGLFDRFGNMVLETDMLPIRWQGYDKNGRLYNPGVFTYVLKTRCGLKEVTEGGSLTLLR